MADADFLIGWRFPRDGLAARAPCLKWIHLTGAGIEHVMPLTWLPDGVALTNNRGVHADKAGEYAAMAVLALNARLPAYATRKAQRRWEQTFATVITGKTVVVVGVGHMGAAAAGRLRALGMHVLGIRASAEPCPGVDEMYAPDQLDRVLPRADFLLLTLPATPHTRGLIGARELDLLRPGAGIVNMARATVMDYPALAERLRDGRISGAILDVFEPEPLPMDSYLWDVPNLIMTPHVSSDDAERYAINTVELFFSNFHKIKNGETLLNLVDHTRQY